MNTTISFRKPPQFLLALVAAATASLPVISSAAVDTASDGHRSLLNAEKRPVVYDEPDELYTRLRVLSRDMCGSSDLRITGNVRRSAQVEQCYEETLSAAVRRLDNPEVMELHLQRTL